MISSLKHADRPWLVGCLLGSLTAAVFLPAVTCDFVNWDDAAYVYENRTVLDGMSASSIRRACTDAVVGCWAPLTMMSYQIDTVIVGTRPAGYHLGNVLLHAAAVATLFVALVRMTAAPGRSAAAVLLFAMHPLRVESVVWVSERKDVLSVLLLGVTLLAYERYCRSPGMARYLGVCAAMLAGLLAKATLVTLPVLLVLLDCWPLGRVAVPGLGGGCRGEGAAEAYPARPWREVLCEKLPLLMLSMIFIAITLHTQQKAIQSHEDMPLLTARLPNAMHAAAWYIWKTVWPSGLHAYYPHPGIAGWPTPELVAAATTLVGLTAAAVCLRTRVPAVAVGLAWFAVSLSPVIGIVAQQGGQAHADRYTYVPHIGLAIAIVWAAVAMIDSLRLPSWAAPTALAAITTVLVAVDQRQIATWKDSISLWNRVLSIEPACLVAHTSLGLALETRGLGDAARAHYAQALSIDPACLPARNNLAGMLIERGELDAARPHVERALHGERDPLTFINLGRLLLADGKPAEAAAAAREAVGIDPDSSSAWFLHGRSLAAQGNLDQALAAYAEVLRIAPDHLQARNNLANLLARLRRFDEAIPIYRSIIERDPHAEATRRNLALALEEQARGVMAQGGAAP